MKEEKLNWNKDEVEALLQWFEGKEFPQEMDVDNATHLPNTAQTIDSLKHIIENRTKISTVLGYVLLLAKIRAKLTGNNTENKAEKEGKA